MDQATRNSLQNATQQARRLLEREITEQLEGTFDVLPNGTIADKPGTHLDASQRLVRTKIVESIRHRAGGSSQAEKLSDAVADYVREAAFTILNRYIALKMLEVRGLVQQCITKGDQSSGFKEFGLAATGLAQLPDKGYRLYLESLFDELSTEVKILFDRHSDASLLWPRRQAFDGLLEILNTQDIASVWKEDETIGWVYQYFNSKDERSAMRDASNAPRNGRELAARNQFFTPRYVVEFLTDNTLGRMWFEMHRGNTSLVEKCPYLLRRPTEKFLGESESPPSEPSTLAGLTQASLLNLPAHIPFRSKKDPRDIKILDPACGSSHFLIYSFDLLLVIYEEAWSDDGSPVSQITGRTLKHDYATIDSLRAAMPGLILRHNVHGIDIDARCAQIGTFALWMRAQRAYNDFGIPKDQRPSIRKSNIVVSEPMPGEDDLLKDFLRDLREDRLESIMRSALGLSPDKTVRATAAMADSLSELVRTVWNSMKLAGEAGSLLRIDKELEAAISKGRSQWEQAPLFRVSQQKADGTERTSLVRHLPGEDEDFWQKAEALVKYALAQFVATAPQAAAFRRSLFAGDAEQGLAFVDQASLRFDAILMNPPFGDPTERTAELLSAAYPAMCSNLLCAFVLSGVSRLAPGGMVGCITDRTFLQKTTYEDFRESILSGVSQLSVLVDLGEGVLDTAQVAASMQVIAQGTGTSHPVLAKDVRQVALDEKGESVQGAVASLLGGCIDGWTVTRTDTFALFPDRAIVYDCPPEVQHAFQRFSPLDPTWGSAKRGISAGDTFRGMRLKWEAPPQNQGVGRRWLDLQNGGSASPFYRDTYLVIWYEGVYAALRPLPGSSMKNLDYVGKVGLSWGKRCDCIQPYPMPRDHAFTDEGQGLFPADSGGLWSLLAILNSRSAQYLLNLFCGQHKSNGYLARLPLPELEANRRQSLSTAGEAIYHLAASIACWSETSPHFGGLGWMWDPKGKQQVTWANAVLELSESVVRAQEECDRHQNFIDLQSLEAFGFSELASVVRDATKNRRPIRASFLAGLGDDREQWRSDAASMTVSYLVGVAFGRWSLPSGPPQCKPQDPFNSIPAFAPCSGEMTHNADDRGQSFVFVDDVGHPRDLTHAVEQAAALAWASGGTLLADAASSLPDMPDLRRWLGRQFFGWHVSRYSRGRRTAPIYWQFATSSANYSLWIYIHRCDPDLLFRCLNDFVLPKLHHEQEVQARMRMDAGSAPTHSQRRDLEDQQRLVDELAQLRDELTIVAPLWSPDLNDGVIVSAAPLWRLFPQCPSWQQECRVCWNSLCAGEYDWSHMAMHLWPERVIPKCVDDASLAIAHHLDVVFWEKDSKGKVMKRKPPLEAGKASWQPTIDRLVEERTSRQMKDALAKLLAVPSPATGDKKGRKAAAETDGGAARNGTKRKSKASTARDESEELF